MSVIVRLAGPEFSVDDNREAFSRIEESIRQFSTHSRETFALVRNPVDIGPDHFALLWSRGSALVLLLPYGGVIHGKPHSRWTTEESQAHTVSETSFEDPLDVADRAARLLEELLTPTDRLPIGVTEAEVRLEERLEPALSSIVIFTGAVGEIRIADDQRANRDAISIEYALSRTMFHMPNLLRLTDRGSLVYTAAEIEVLSAELDLHAGARSTAREPIAPGLQSFRRARRTSRTKSKTVFFGILALVTVGILYFSIRPDLPSDLGGSSKDTAAAPVHRSISTIIIHLPVETQLFVADCVFEARSQLDHALSHGSGIRYLPDTEQMVRLDSLRFARGVYGYFKVQNVWRKGKLLQTFRPYDTIVVDNFLEPLK